MFFAPVVRTTRHVRGTRAPFDRAFDAFINDALYGAPSRSLNVTEDEKAWTVTLDVPGVARDDLNIQVEGAVVRIETRAEAPRQYKAAYELPQDIDVDATEAKLDNGVLTLKLAKLQPVSKARQIKLA